MHLVLGCYERLIEMVTIEADRAVQYKLFERIVFKTNLLTKQGSFKANIYLIYVK